MARSSWSAGAWWGSWSAGAAFGAPEHPSRRGALRGAYTLTTSLGALGSTACSLRSVMSGRLVCLTAIWVGLSLLLGTAACSDAGGAAQTTTPVGSVATSTTTSEASPSTTIVAPEDLEPVVQPTLPADVPGYLSVDPATGLHMTGTPTVVDLAS